MTKPVAGSIGWLDLTVDDAAEIKDFYEEVIGWSADPVDMGDYADFNMVASGEPRAGVCHARGSNSGQPAVWIAYIYVEALERSLEAVRRRGGEVVVEPRSAGSSGKYAVIRDPAGAFLGLFEPAEASDDAQ